VIYASHYMEEVEAICRRVAIIDQGKLLALGTLDELIGKPEPRKLVSGTDRTETARLMS